MNVNSVTEIVDQSMCVTVAGGTLSMQNGLPLIMALDFSMIGLAIHKFTSQGRWVLSLVMLFFAFVNVNSVSGFVAKSLSGTVSGGTLPMQDEQPLVMAPDISMHGLALQQSVFMAFNRCMPYAGDVDASYNITLRRQLMHWSLSEGWTQWRLCDPEFCFIAAAVLWLEIDWDTVSFYELFQPVWDDDSVQLVWAVFCWWIFEESLRWNLWRGRQIKISSATVTMWVDMWVEWRSLNLRFLSQQCGAVRLHER